MDWRVLWSNFALPSDQGLPAALFFGFAASMLGISGFESSANFVEEQAEDVFPRTLRNMWVAVSVFNPTLALLALALVPIPDVAPNEEALLAHMGGIAAGEWLAWLISVDAILVLSGAVLTSYVGVTGLVQRMTLDRCLPQFLLKIATRARTYHRIIVLFFCICVSILFITGGRARRPGRGLHALVPVGDGAVRRRQHPAQGQAGRPSPSGTRRLAGRQSSPLHSPCWGWRAMSS